MYTIILSNPNRTVVVDASRFYSNGAFLVFTRTAMPDNGIDEHPSDVAAFPYADVKSVTKRAGIVSHRYDNPTSRPDIPTMASPEPVTEYIPAPPIHRDAMVDTRMDFTAIPTMPRPAWDLQRAPRGTARIVPEIARNTPTAVYDDEVSVQEGGY